MFCPDEAEENGTEKGPAAHFLVLHFLGEGLQRIAQNHRYIYAGLAILLMIGQAVLLQNVTTFLLRLIRRTQ